MFIAIGSIAWLFDIKKRSNSAVPESKGAQVYSNEKASISSEELNAGNKEPTMEDKILSKFTYPGSEPASKPPSQKPKVAYKPMEWGDVTQKPEDPTLDYSILLIAKPIPFEFDLTPRNATRVKKARDMFREGVENGDFPEAKGYWGPDQGRTKPVGWSKV